MFRPIVRSALEHRDPLKCPDSAFAELLVLFPFFFVASYLFLHGGGFLANKKYHAKQHWKQEVFFGALKVGNLETTSKTRDDTARWWQLK